MWPTCIIIRVNPGKRRNVRVRYVSNYTNQDLEDCAGMRIWDRYLSWYALSSMGIYAVTPGIPIYNIGSPHVRKGRDAFSRQ